MPPSIGPNPNKVRKKHFLRAIKLAEQCRGEDDRPHPKVGVVIVKDGEIETDAFRGEIGKGDHAEFIALERKSRGNPKIEGADLVTTLEPCTRRSHDKRPCVSWIKTRRIRKVWIGTLDYNPVIMGEGETALREDGILIGRFPDDLQIQILEQNRAFFQYVKSRQPSLSLSELKGRTDILRELIYTELVELNKRELVHDEAKRNRNLIQAAFQKLLTIEPDDPLRWNEIGWFLYNAEFYGASGFAFQTSTKIDATFNPGWVGFGASEIEMYLRAPRGTERFTDSLHKAMTYLDKAFKLDSSPNELHMTAWYALSEIWEKIGETEYAKKCLKRAQVLLPTEG